MASDLPHIILVRPQEQGNVGAAARAMANMGLSRMVIVEPGVPIGHTARAFAVGAGHVLDGQRRAASLEEALAPYQRVVGTTSTRDRQLAGGIPVVGPRELPAILADDPPGTATAIVFGPEASGLTREELHHTSPVVSVPCAPEQPTLNLAQAVLVVAYELHAARLQRQGGAEPRETPSSEEDRPASAAQREGLLAHVEETLQAVGFGRNDSFPVVLADLRSLAARAALTRREVAILRGICRRTLHLAKKQD